MDVALKIMESLEKHGLNQFSLQEFKDGQMNLILNEGLLITSIGDEDTYLEVLERIISECATRWSYFVGADQHVTRIQKRR